MTPLQEFIEVLKIHRDTAFEKAGGYTNLKEYYDARGQAFADAITFAKWHLEKEKESIVETSKNSYIAGYLDNQAKVYDPINFSEYYYNETFKTKE